MELYEVRDVSCNQILVIIIIIYRALSETQSVYNLKKNMQHIIYSHSNQWHKMKQIHSFICMLESDWNHYASHQSTQCNTHQSTQCNTHQSTQCNTHQSTRYNCHWQELPQVFFVTTKENMSFVTTKVCLLQQTYFCRDKTFVTTNVILAKLQQMCLL